MATRDQHLTEEKRGLISAWEAESDPDREHARVPEWQLRGAADLLALTHGWDPDVDTGASKVLAAVICRVISITADIEYAEHGEDTPHASVRQIAELRHSVERLGDAIDDWVHDMEAAAKRGS